MFIWNDNDVRIFETCTFSAESQAVVGSALVGKQNIPLAWTAKATPHGYSVIVRDTRGRTEAFQGPTFNVFLEVAAALRRFTY